ncbi:mycofactocin system transcriptional regulator [Epidermidibacterium keratini]|uniref:Mycofactocin system transcriptional regulator n=1 Tax=Epidermidibacterium keratini TaxID=1891644 RepID=A0A7L4YLT4_9ACTN|nr:mycofactocin system transcriptional regulator [Epidermidibacterium keratini]QHC00090.1 mycofactocin system transcriptional regulator [Epidermidibacterium keratini]
MARSAPDIAPPRPGRRPSTSLEEIERAGLALFADRGFDAVSVDDIAAEVGIGRRTFFRYYPSKNDLVWGRFDELIDEWEAWMRAHTAEMPLLQAIRAAVLHFNDFPEDDDTHRLRMSLILQNPALQAHATLRYQRWRDAIARYSARRLGVDNEAFTPRVIGHIALGAALASYEQWLLTPDADLRGLLDDALTVLAETVRLPG